METTGHRAPDVISIKNEASETSREEFLHRLLGVDYDYALESGLIDVFYYNPETNEDGLAHVLVGDEALSANGSREVSGYHHESSAARADTYVDYQEMENKSAKRKREFRTAPFNPYSAFVVVRGFEKQVLHPDNSRGKGGLVRASSTMFPREYDALSVMQTIRLARDRRDRNNDEVTDDGLIIANSFMYLLDGQVTVPIRLVLHSETDKVITAFPLFRRQDLLTMDKDEIRTHLGLGVA